MISLFRNFFQSKIGLPIFIIFLGVVALAFAGSDISGSSTFGGLTGNDKLAVVGDEDITGSELTGVMNTALRRERDQNPTLTMEQYVAGGGLEGQLGILIERSAIGQFAKLYGLRAGDNLVNSEILEIGAFRNLTGEFDEEVYRNALRQQGITDAILRRDIASGLLAQQLLRTAFASPQVPEKVVQQYAAIGTQRRQGQIGLIPAMKYAPEGDPSDEQLNTFYSENRSDYIRPERRTLRFATFGAEKVTAETTPNEAQVAARYERDAVIYSEQEARSITSFVVPTQEAAQSLAERIRGGLSLEAAAQEAGFSVSVGSLRDREAMNSSTSFAVGEAVFAAEEGAIIEPAESSVGWVVARLDQIERTPARSLDEVRADIVSQLETEGLAAALADLSSQIEEKVNGGTSLADVAEEFGLEINVLPGLTANGQIFGLPGQTVPPTLQPVIDPAFEMEQGKPQLGQLVAGTQFIVFDVSEITESDAPPLEGELKEQVITRWRMVEGNKAAKDVAARITEAVRGGASMRDAMREEDPELVQIQDINMTRSEIPVGPNGRPQPALALLFSMAQGSTKTLEDSNSFGWYVLDLDSIELSDEELSEDITNQIRSELQTGFIAEYSAQFSDAAEAEIGVERNPDALDALRSSLIGNGAN